MKGISGDVNQFMFGMCSAVPLWRGIPNAHLSFPDRSGASLPIVEEGMLRRLAAGLEPECSIRGARKSLRTVLRRQHDPSRELFVFKKIFEMECKNMHNMIFYPLLRVRRQLRLFSCAKFPVSGLV